MECWILCVFKVCPILFLKSLWSLFVAKRRNQGQISAMQASGAENLRDFSYLFLSSLCLKTPPPNLVAAKVAGPRDGLGMNGFEAAWCLKKSPRLFSLQHLVNRNIISLAFEYHSTS